MKRERTLPCTLFSLAFLILWIGGSQPACGDWPTYRGDSRRSGISAEGLKLPLAETWVHKAVHRPQPAWPELPAKCDVWHRIAWLSPTVTYDRAFQVVVVGECLYYGSSADDTLYCLDVSTGKTRWCFRTEGPVRLAPTVVDGRVYVGSDDGRVYCLDAGDGSLFWKYRAGPADRRLPGNGRMISLWPVRCGIVVDGGTVYFCAGLFPSQGAYLCAVGAEEGKQIWKQKVNVSSQGYLLASPARLFVPTGRTAPHIYERASGKDLGELPGGGVECRAGGCFAVLVEDLLAYSGGEEQNIRFSDAKSAEKIVSTPGRRLDDKFTEKIVSTSGLRLVADRSTAYILTKDRLKALDRTKYMKLSRQIAPLERKKERTEEENQRIGELNRQRKACWKWDVPCNAPYELVMAGETIFAGGEDRVVAYSAADGKVVWTGTVTGKAYGLALSGGRLLVSTDEGTIHCFEPGAAGQTPAVVSEVPEKESPYPDDRWTLLYKKAAATAVNTAGVKKGYCLVLGAGTGRLAYEIARRSEFQVIGLEPDAEKVATARKLLGKVGLYGTRIAIHHGRLDKLPYQKYFANLVTSDKTLVTGKLPTCVEEVFRVLRPCGGFAIFGSPKGLDPEALKQWKALPGWTTEGDQRVVAIGKVRRGPLEGAGEWTHFHADAGNSACSRDTIRLEPMDVQWFGRPGPRRMVDRHDKNVAPLYKNGRLFISGDNYILAVDAYNGTILWEHNLPDSIRLGAFKNGGSMAATDGCLYVASGSRCIGFDAQTGRQKLALSVPAAADGRTNEWGYVACVDNILFGSDTKPGATFRIQDLDTETLIWRDFMPVVCSDSLFAHNRRTGEKLWTYTPGAGVIINPTIAVGGGRLYLIESTNPDTHKVANGRIKLDMLLGTGSNLLALDMRTGNVLWKKPAELQALQHIIFLSYAKETLVITGTKNVLVDEKQRVRYDLCAFDAATGESLWKNTQTPIPDHIIQGGHGEQVQHSAIVGETIYNTGFACNLRTGQPIAGWKWRKSPWCGTISTSAYCAFSRYANSRMFDLNSGEFANLTSVTRPGCWINTIPAGGLILIPEASSGCTCAYSIQTSLALVPRDGER